MMVGLNSRSGAGFVLFQLQTGDILDISDISDTRNRLHAME